MQIQYVKAMPPFQHIHCIKTSNAPSDWYLFVIYNTLDTLLQHGLLHNPAGEREKKKLKTLSHSLYSPLSSLSLPEPSRYKRPDELPESHKSYNLSIIRKRSTTKKGKCFCYLFNFLIYRECSAKGWCGMGEALGLALGLQLDLSLWLCANQHEKTNRRTSRRFSATLPNPNQSRPPPGVLFTHCLCNSHRGNAKRMAENLTDYTPSLPCSSMLCLQRSGRNRICKAVSQRVGQPSEELDWGYVFAADMDS